MMGDRPIQKSVKANPSLGVTVKVDDLKRQIDEAKKCRRMPFGG